MDVVQFLREYDGPPVRLMEVCGTHTAEIERNGIPGMLSPNITLVSGPGCPVCVTVTAYIDKLTALAMQPDHAVVSFGDMLRVPGAQGSLNDVRAQGGDVRMVYSPLDMLALAAAEPQKTFVFAAVGFETTTPAYALLVAETIQKEIENVKLLTSLKTMPAVIDWVCRSSDTIDGFIAPGNVSVITGSDLYRDLAERYNLPFVIAGFTGNELLAAIYTLMKRQGAGGVYNLYPSVVTAQGNKLAQETVSKYFEPCSAAWRGMGVIADSGMMLRPEYSRFDAGSAGLDADMAHPGCCCAQVVTGSLSPGECPMLGESCTPEVPLGACMVSSEGSCYHYYTNRKQII